MKWKRLSVALLLCPAISCLPALSDQERIYDMPNKSLEVLLPQDYMDWSHYNMREPDGIVDNNFYRFTIRTGYSFVIDTIKVGASEESADNLGFYIFRLYLPGNNNLHNGCSWRHPFYVSDEKEFTGLNLLVGGNESFGINVNHAHEAGKTKRTWFFIKGRVINDCDYSSSPAKLPDLALPLFWYDYEIP
jgi:hypothetical protein